MCFRKAPTSHEIERSFPIVGQFFFTVISLIILPLSSPAQGKILRHEATGLEQKSFSFKDVCRTVGESRTLIIERIGQNGLDCMGKKISATKFCSSQLKNEPLLRGLVLDYEDRVVCQTGSSVSLSLGCYGKSLREKYCEDAKLGCRRLGKIYAFHLESHHSSLLPDGADHRLNCYYQSIKVIDNLQEPEKLIDPKTYLRDLYKNSLNDSEPENNVLKLKVESPSEISLEAI